MKQKTMFFIIISILYLNSFLSNLPAVENNYYSLDKCIVAPNAIAMPLGKFLLLRKNSQYGAIRFISIKEKNAVYEWYFQADKDSNLLNKGTQKGKGEVRDKYIPIIGRFSIQLGTLDIRCGSNLLEWSPPNWVYFYSTKDSQKDIGIELAPTNYSDIVNMNLHDNKLKWYRFDENRKDFEIKLYELK